MRSIKLVQPSWDRKISFKDLDTYGDGALKVDKLLPEAEKLNIIDDIVVITLIIKLSGKYSGVAFEADFRYIRFWKKIGDGIKVVGGGRIAI